MSDPKDTAKLVRKLAKRLDGLAGDLTADAASRDAFEDVVVELRALVARHFGPRPRAAHGQGASFKVLGYLKANVGRWVHGDELAAVSGIQEWARRVRELRVEQGYDIEERDRRYRLRRTTPDKAVAEKWRTANAIRIRPGSARDRIAAFLAASVGTVLTRDELDYVAKIKEGSRRVRELRDEYGWPIESHIDDRAMQPGQYRLVSADPADRRDTRQRLYPEDLRARIFERDNYTCQKCGRDKLKAGAAGDTRFYLEVHHRNAVAEQLDALPADELNDEANLVTYCHADHLIETAEFQRRRRGERGG